MVNTQQILQSSVMTSKTLLIQKNIKYGDSALNPVRVDV